MTNEFACGLLLELHRPIRCANHRGSRFSFGYPACPNMEDQALLLDLLGVERLGLTMSDEFQLHPEQSTSAIVFHHPSAKYFTIERTSCIQLFCPSSGPRNTPPR